MSFIWPGMLLLLVSVPFLVLLYLGFQRRRARIIYQFGSLGFAQGTSGKPLGWHRHLPIALFLLALCILMIAMARPQTVLSLPREQGTVILAFDTSGSMSADDLKPTRMQAAQTAAQAFIAHQPLTVQIGVVSFSDSGFPVQVPTNDKDAVLASINRLAPAHGTSLANGILSSLAALSPRGVGNTPRLYSNLTPAPTPTPTPVPQGKHASAVIILLSDGENNESPDPLAAAQAAAKQGVRIYTVGIGSPSGSVIHVDGFSIQTQLDEDMLQKIAQITGGKYYSADSAAQLSDIYGQLNPGLVVKPEKTEVTFAFALAGGVVMLVAGLFSMLWFNRLP